MGGRQLAAIEHIVVLMLENRSFDHMLGFLYEDRGNDSPAGRSVRRTHRQGVKHRR